MFVLFALVPLLVRTDQLEIKLNTEVSKPKVKNFDLLFDMYARGDIKGDPNDYKLPSGNIFYEGWVKYFHFDTLQKAKKPRDFFQNNEFYHQKVKTNNYLDKDENGRKYISDQFHFYITVNKENLNIFSSRQDAQILKSIDTLHLDLINRIPKDNITKGGVQKMGNFDEGYCIQIFTTAPAGPDPKFDIADGVGVQSNWIFCLDI
jgi:hypothetical protein